MYMMLMAKKVMSGARTDPGWIYDIWVKAQSGRSVKVLSTVDVEDVAIQIGKAIKRRIVATAESASVLDINQ